MPRLLSGTSENCQLISPVSSFATLGDASLRTMLWSQSEEVGVGTGALEQDAGTVNASGSTPGTTSRNLAKARNRTMCFNSKAIRHVVIIFTTSHKVLKMHQERLTNWRDLRLTFFWRQFTVWKVLCIKCRRMFGFLSIPSSFFSSCCVAFEVYKTVVYSRWKWLSSLSFLLYTFLVLTW